MLLETHSGERLVLSNVDRSQMGAYLCIASNDVPPARTKERRALAREFSLLFTLSDIGPEMGQPSWVSSQLRNVGGGEEGGLHLSPLQGGLINDHITSSL
ncbi:unnamed protein product [Nezara viridula]|uniref:Uncharacterized protein n=1 Tax=Nezara viridula TaxID=85310 RepID=A0A9P0HQH7_NEZVI|nr:unnamed protein product [Nezara viridula]